MPALLCVLDPDGARLTAASAVQGGESGHQLTESFPNWDMHKSTAVPYRVAATNIYKQG